jgi:hypothetical protein
MNTLSNKASRPDCRHLVKAGAYAPALPGSRFWPAVVDPAEVVQARLRQVGELAPWRETATHPSARLFARSSSVDYC